MVEYNDYVMKNFGEADAAAKWGRHGLYDPASNEGKARYNNKIYRMQYVLDDIPEARSNDARALDLGCGGGVFIPAIRDKGYAVTAVDISEEMIALSKELCSAKHIEADLVVGDCNKTMFPDDHFDLIVCVGVIEHQKSDDPLFREIHRIIKPGGTLIITFRNWLCPHIRYRYVMAEVLRWAQGVVRRGRGQEPFPHGKDGYTKRWDSREHSSLALASKLRKAGFGSIRSRYSHFYVLPFPFDRRYRHYEIRLAKPLEALNRSPLRWLGSTGIFIATKRGPDGW